MVWFMQKRGGWVLLLLPTLAYCLLGGVPTPAPSSSISTTTSVPQLSSTTLTSSTSPLNSSPNLPGTSTPASTVHSSAETETFTSTVPPTASSSPSTTSPSTLPTTIPPSSLSTTPTPTTIATAPPTTNPTVLPETSLPSSIPTTSPPRPTRKAPTRRPVPPRPPWPLLPHTAPPLFKRKPFTVSWNIPDLVCNRYNVSLDTSAFQGVATPAKVPGQFLSLFYTDRLGLYPHVDLTARQQLYGGIPQRGDLKASLAKAQDDINYYIPSRTRRGLAVIDWEEWRPLWVRNWGTKQIYRNLSVSHARKKHRSLSSQQAVARAKQQFQAAARSYMSETLSLGRRMRPSYLWGFYLFPNCYNNGWLEPGYTGRCSRQVQAENDQLLWLWEASSALYPSIYLQTSLGDTYSAALLVRNRVHEALRVSALPKRPATAPVFAYMRPVFTDSNRRFLSEGDLVSTIGESAAVGASGAVVWGASADYDDKTSCEALSAYLASTLNPYIANVTAAARLCSDFLCQGNGRCVRRHYSSDHYLHLSSGNFRIRRTRGRYRALGRPSAADLRFFATRFTCQCYSGLTCSPSTPPRQPSKAPPHKHTLGLQKKKTKTLKTRTSLKAQSSGTKDKVRKKNLKQ